MVHYRESAGFEKKSDKQKYKTLYGISYIYLACIISLLNNTHTHTQTPRDWDI